LKNKMNYDIISSMLRILCSIILLVLAFTWSACCDEDYKSQIAEENEAKQQILDDVDKDADKNSSPDKDDPSEEPAYKPYTPDYDEDGEALNNGVHYIRSMF